MLTPQGLYHSQTGFCQSVGNTAHCVGADVCIAIRYLMNAFLRSESTSETLPDSDVSGGAWLCGGGSGCSTGLSLRRCCTPISLR